MGLGQCCVIVLTLSTQLVLTFPTSELTQDDTMSGTKCQLCPAGQFQKSCAECQPCPPGSYTTEWNREDRCHRCSGDCRPVFHLKVFQRCTSESDVKCICEPGFTCIDRVSYSANCRYCEKIQETTTTETGAVISGKDKHTPSPTSPGRNDTSAKPCQFPQCGSQSVLVAGNGTQLETDQMRSQLSAIICGVVIMGCLALGILCLVLKHRDESCSRQGIALLVCDEGRREASHTSKESTHRFSRDSFSFEQQQPSSLSAANLGPVHVHNPGMVVFGLLSQFTGQVGHTIEGLKTDERGRSKEEDDDDDDCPVFHPTSSTGAPLSEEEQSGETESFLFPSQEQGKDCHLSREEVL